MTGSGGRAGAYLVNTSLRHYVSIAQARRESVSPVFMAAVVVAACSAG
jgi:hypothetical protein